jgi:hypothetical protein
MKRKLFTEIGMTDAVFVIHTFDGNNDTTNLYTAERIKEYPIEKPNEWEEIHLRIWLPNSFGGGDKVKLYIWNKGKEDFELDDFKINVQVPIW